MAIYKDEVKTKDGRQWFFQVYRKGKTYKSKRYLTKSEAQEEERLFLMKKENPIHKNFDLVAKDYLKNVLSTRKESTYYSNKSVYENQIKPYFAKYDISDITFQEVNEWKSIMLKKGYKLTYLNKSYTIFSSIFDYAIKNYGLSINIVKNCGTFELPKEEVIKNEDKIRYITYPEFQQFISVIDNHEWVTYFSFLYYTGVRLGESQAITWKDINFVDKSVVINKTLSVKTDEAYKITSTKNYLNRVVKINKTLIELLKEHKEQMMKYTEFEEDWFVFGNDRFLPRTTIDRQKHKYFEKSGVKEITIHEFRHSCVSLLINEYIKSGQTDTTKFFLMVGNRTGHSVDVMQKVYLHLFPTIQNEIIDILDNL